MPCCKRKKKFDPKTLREIILNEYSEEEITISQARKTLRSTREKEKKKLTYSRNITKTSRYNILNFLVIALYFHFRKLTNLYFLGLTILLAIPSFSTLSLGSTLTPLIFITLVSLLREAYEDIARHRNDE